MNIANLSQLKKALAPGVEFEILLHNRPECVGQIRRVTKANTAGFYTTVPNAPNNQANAGNGGMGLYCEWGPARFWSFDAKGTCTRYTSKPGGQFSNIIMAFKILEVAHNEAE